MRACVRAYMRAYVGGVDGWTEGVGWSPIPVSGIYKDEVLKMRIVAILTLIIKVHVGLSDSLLAKTVLGFFSITYCG